MKYFCIIFCLHNHLPFTVLYFYTSTNFKQNIQNCLMSNVLHLVLHWDKIPVYMKRSFFVFCYLAQAGTSLAIFFFFSFTTGGSERHSSFRQAQSISLFSLLGERRWYFSEYIQICMYENVSLYMWTMHYSAPVQQLYATPCCLNHRYTYLDAALGPARLVHFRAVIIIARVHSVPLQSGNLRNILSKIILFQEYCTQKAG